ncbi:hypothetical protein CIB48_g3526 [Xylaria polymorpha]|nr:hypothetical protein CIB48_g3526 [Xylaria polymorpha]
MGQWDNAINRQQGTSTVGYVQRMCVCVCGVVVCGDERWRRGSDMVVEDRVSFAKNCGERGATVLYVQRGLFEFPPPPEALSTYLDDHTGAASPLRLEDLEYAAVPSPVDLLNTVPTLPTVHRSTKSAQCSAQRPAQSGPGATKISTKIGFTACVGSGTIPPSIRPRQAPSGASERPDPSQSGKRIVSCESNRIECLHATNPIHHPLREARPWTNRHHPKHSRYEAVAHNSVSHRHRSTVGYRVMMHSGIQSIVGKEYLSDGVVRAD